MQFCHIIAPDFFHATNQKNAEFWLLFFWYRAAAVGALREMQKCPTGRCFVASSTSQVAAAAGCSMLQTLVKL